MTHLILSVLSVYSVTLIVSNYDGPYDMLIKLRDKWSPEPIRKLLSCFVCLSAWISIPFAAALSESLHEFILYWLGLAGAAIIVYRITER